VRIADDIPAVLIGDDMRLSQVLLNLLSNAIKFTERGTITVTAELLGIDGDMASIRCAVSDTGIGMTPSSRRGCSPPSRRPTIRPPGALAAPGWDWRSAARSSNRWAAGSASKARRARAASFLPAAAQDRRRRDRRSSGPPIRRRDDPTKPPKDALAGDNPAGDGGWTGLGPPCPRLPPDLHGLRVLLVEDNEINREIAVELLTDAGLLVDCAEDGEIACAMVADHGAAYAAILMDVQMPRLDGISATREIRKAGPPTACRSSP
jgi:CheY-like chemotaxis protein